MSTNMIHWDHAEGVVVLTMDDPDGGANTINQKFLDSLGETVDRLEAEKDSYSGVIITSAKKTFLAGADLAMIIKASHADGPVVKALLDQLKAQLRRIETLGKPVVAAINGAALGGGLELALACHHRVALNAKGSEIGLPEVTLGLLPGGGGIVRTTRMFGLQKALMEVLLQGQRRKPAEALAVGLVDEIAETPEAMHQAARAWIAANPAPSQPWDVKGYKMPGGTPSSPSLAQFLPAFPANLRKQTKGAPMPAPLNIMAAAVEGAQVDIATAEKIETELFVELATGQVSSNMIQAFFFDLQHITKGGARPAGFEQYHAKKILILGAGMMGAGIAYVCARAGMEVILRDTSLEAAEKGKAYSTGLLDKAVSRGKMTAEAREEILARIHPTVDAADAQGADLLIEAVFENPDLKKQVYSEVEQYLAPDALLGSNTSTLPITDLATGVTRPEDFIGLHFFSPVDKMPLLEIVVGEKTSDATIAKAIDLALQIKKTPIVVNDSRGFFTSRVIMTFMGEAVALLAEGVPAPSIEQAALQSGYPTGPLALFDEISILLGQRIYAETRRGAEAAGKPLGEHPAFDVVNYMVDDAGRGGRGAGAGFYDYAGGKRLGLWAGLVTKFGGSNTAMAFEDVKERMLFAEVLESVRCYEEGVLRSVPEANIGSIFGIGFPPWSGGVLQFVNGYSGGVAGFVARAHELAGRYGERFEPTAGLVAMASEGRRFE